MVIGYPSDKGKKDCTVLAHKSENCSSALLKYRMEQKKGTEQKLVTSAGKQTQEIRYYRTWALFLPKAELLLGQQIKMNRQFLAANSAGHSEYNHPK